MLFNERDCLNYDPFQGDEMDVKELSNKIVTSRTEHKCNICWELIPPKSRIRALREINREEQKVATFYFCTECCVAMASSWTDNGRSITQRTVKGMAASGNWPVHVSP
jgi:hypothetical protein